MYLMLDRVRLDLILGQKKNYAGSEKLLPTFK
jgi:hypothetical protein